LLASAEGTAFEIAKGRYSETANFNVFLKGHSGDPLRTNRITRQGERVDRPALSCALAIQPDVIRGLAEQTSMKGRGFVYGGLAERKEEALGERIGGGQRLNWGQAENKASSGPLASRIQEQFRLLLFFPFGITVR
jgi:hypothetical protein